MKIEGLSIIGAKRGGCGGKTFTAVNPAGGETLPGEFCSATAAEIESATWLAAEAFAIFSRWSGANANNAPPNVSDEELARLLIAASRLALSNDSADKTMAYVATRIVELDRKTQSGFIDVAEIILARLGNFPGRELLRKRYASNQTERKLPLCFTLETCAREFENTVEAGEGHVVTLTDFQHDLFSALQNSSAVSASAPTSAGKSFVLSLDIIRRLRRTPHCSVVYVVPTRALIRQVMLSIVKDLNAAGLQDVPVRCVPIPIEHSKAVDGVVYVLTQERLMSLLNSEEGTPWVSVLIVDEAQGIGAALERECEPQNENQDRKFGRTGAGKTSCRDARGGTFCSGQTFQGRGSQRPSRGRQGWSIHRQDGLCSHDCAK